MKATTFHFISTILLLVFLSGCGGDKQVVELPPRPVYTIAVPELSSTSIRTFSGQLQAAEGVNLAFEVGGRVIEVIAKQGQFYPANALLARLDDSDYQNSLDNARASLTQADQELRRAQRLFESGNASQSQLDGAIAQEKSAQANYNSALKRLNDTSLKMPYEGVIASVNIDAQQVVSTGQSAMSIQGEGPMEFAFGAPTDVVGLLSTGQALTIRLGDIASRTFDAAITEISPSSLNNTTYAVTAALASSDDSFRVGMDGEATVELARENGDAMLIPLVCVVSAAGGKQFVWVAVAQEDGLAKIERREVSVESLEMEGQVSILSGLNPGERVVSRGVNKVEDGMIVRLKEGE